MNDLTEITGLQRYPLARRGFVMTSLISWLHARHARGSRRRRSIPTPPASTPARSQIPVKDGNLPAYYARPAEGHRLPGHPGQ